MAILHLLGTGAALSDPHRTTTMLAVENDASLIVIDCGGDVVQTLMAANVNLNKLSAIIITHEHPDHVSGFPLFMEKIWLAGRRERVSVYGIAPALAQAKRTHDAFNTSDWPNYPSPLWLEVKHHEHALVLSNDQWHITASPGQHSVPVVGLRVEDKQKGGIMTYSCDTEFSEAIVRLAQDSDILVHEATGDFPSHTNAIQAAEAAKRAKAKRLLLVHLPFKEAIDPLMAEAQTLFQTTEKGLEGGKYEF